MKIRKIVHSIDKIKKEYDEQCRILERIRRERVKLKIDHGIELECMNGMVDDAKTKRKKIRCDVEDDERYVEIERTVSSKIKQNQIYASRYKSNTREWNKKLGRYKKDYERERKKNKQLTMQQKIHNEAIIKCESDTRNIVQMVETNHLLEEEKSQLVRKNTELILSFNQWETKCENRLKSRLICENSFSQIMTVVTKQVRNVKIKREAKKLNVEIANNAYDLLSQIANKYEIS